VLGALAGYVVLNGPSFSAAAYRASAQCPRAIDNAIIRSGIPIRVAELCDIPAALGQALVGQLYPAPSLSGQSSSPITYPLKVSANGRYLVDQMDTPFLMIGDAPQGMIGDLTSDDAELYVANRERYGINTLWINLLCTDSVGCHDSNGTTLDGISPFTTAGDVSTPNERYFARVDSFLSLAAKHRINVLLDPIETSSWLPVLRTNGQDRDYNYGRYLGTRYKSFPNIIWMSGNDFQSWRDPQDDLVVLAVAQGIRDADPAALQTIELDYYVSGSLDDPNWAPLIQLDAAYTYRPTYAEVLKEFNRPNSMPVFMVEANYEFEHDCTGPQTLRRQEYWSLLSGAAGHIYGSKFTWPFPPGWKDHLDTIGIAQLAYATNLFVSREWYALVPDQNHSAIIGGYGTFSDSSTVNDSDYVTAASTPDGSLVLAYIPTQRTISVDMTTLAGPVRVRWYDPASGTYTSIAGSPLANAGTYDFATPGKNHDGDPDWVLVLEANQAP